MVRPGRGQDGPALLPRAVISRQPGGGVLMASWLAAAGAVRLAGCGRRRPGQWGGVVVTDLIDALGELPAVGGAAVAVVVDGVVELRPPVAQPAELLQV